MSQERMGPRRYIRRAFHFIRDRIPFQQKRLNHREIMETWMIERGYDEQFRKDYFERTAGFDWDELARRIETGEDINEFTRKLFEERPPQIPDVIKEFLRDRYGHTLEEN